MFDLDRFIVDCQAALTEQAPELAIKELLERSVTDARAIESRLGTPREGGIAVLHRAPDLTILNVVWTPGMTVFPHDHLMWAAIGLYGGREDNVFYRRTAGGLAAAGGRQIDPGTALVLGRDVIHAVSNPLQTFTGAIHVYGGDLVGTPRSEWPPDGSGEQPFDVERARKIFAAANERWSRERATAGSA